MQFLDDCYKLGAIKTNTCPPAELQLQYTNFKNTLQQLAQKIGDIEQEAEEHKSVIRLSFAVLVYSYFGSISMCWTSRLLRGTSTNHAKGDGAQHGRSHANVDLLQTGH